MTHYELLGVNNDAKTDEIKAAFRRLAMIHHPDRLSNPRAEALKDSKAKFAAAQEAYSVLSTDFSRARYDSSLCGRYSQPLANYQEVRRHYQPTGPWLRGGGLGTRVVDHFLAYSGPVLWFTFLGLVFVKAMASCDNFQERTELKKQAPP
eukprot:CAMPEP_0196571364 /NCGR_PEP_ID=MMETSP1081-20130531/1540_1 /TAXON_ID=36882 /ORGANISM="Pyramimonas amylifera, Strain CCMP720" /LENGTH=149 /DNA_ID=CAMNT_0041888273 /DNA_START=126 /DNA_END=575 /DNA_ORIENTATION=-